MPKMFLNRKVFIGAIILSIILIGTGTSYAEPMSSTSYTLESNVIDSFGSSKESANYKLYDSGGQSSVVGTSESLTGPNFYQMAMGFIYTIFGGANRPGTLECERAGANIKLKWQGCDQADIYTLTPASDHYYDYNSLSWTKVIPSVTGTTEWVDDTVSGCQQRYYRVAAAGTDMYALAPSGSMEAVGKFDLALPSTAADPSRLFISTPLEPFNGRITAEIGSQATEGDMIGIFDINLNTLALSVYSGGTWLDAFTGEKSTMEMKLGRSYAYYTETPKTVSMIGRVCDHDQVSTFEGGNVDTTCAYIAPAFPSAPRSINDSNLNNNTSVGYDPTEAAAIGLFDNNWNTLGFAMHTAPAHWDVYIGTEFNLEPGRGYVFLEPIQHSVTWVQKP
jgi:hypothetical protein